MFTCSCVKPNVGSIEVGVGDGGPSDNEHGGVTEAESPECVIKLWPERSPPLLPSFIIPKIISQLVYTL